MDLHREGFDTKGRLLFRNGALSNVRLNLEICLCTTRANTSPITNEGGGTPIEKREACLAVD